MKKFYMMVSNDELELPLCPPMPARDFADKLKMDVGCLMRNYGAPSAIKILSKRKRSYKKFKIVCIELEEQ